MESTLVAPYPVPPNEQDRLAALYALDILDTEAEHSFDRIVKMAARLLNAPIALVSLVDRDRQWFKAKCGVDASETAREFSFCTHAMLGSETMVVCDATRDARFWENPFVTGSTSVRFYAGAPLRTRDGLGLGSLCVIDTVAREWPSQGQLDNLEDLAYLVSQQLEMRLSEKARRANEARLNEAQRIAHVGHWEWDPQTRFGLWSDETYRLFGLPPQTGISLERFENLLPPEDRKRVMHAFSNCLQTGEPYAVTHRIVRPNGSVIHVEARGRMERGKIAGTLLDVTARVQADMLLRQSKEDLERQVAERTKTENERLEAVVEARTGQLTRLLTEKDILLKEVHHRVKNNLQIISSLLRMHGERVRDPAAASALADSRRRVLSMALIHEQLYGSQQMNAIDFGEYALMLVNELFCSCSWEGKITSRVEAASVLLRIDQAIPLGLILNELVTNALKYAYPAGTGGEVLVELKELETEVCLAVSDQGAGLPAGWELKNKGTLGLPIVDMLAKQLGGKLTLENGHGTRFSVTFRRCARQT
jgi:PAS domain S-box-containing protein